MSKKKIRNIFIVILLFISLIPSSYAIYREKKQLSASLNINAPSYTITLDTNKGNLVLWLDDISTQTEGDISYSVSSGVVTVSSTSSSSQSIYTKGRVNLEAGKSYTFTCSTTSTIGTNSSVFLSLNGDSSTTIDLTSNEYTFTPQTSGEYYLGFGITSGPASYTFSNLNVTEINNTITVKYGTAYGSLPVPKKRYNKFLGWFYNGSQVDNNTIMNVASNHTLQAMYQEIWAEDLSYDNTDTPGLNCEEVQCALDYIKEVLDGKKCKRATAAQLHTETCRQTANYCYADGYYVGGSKNTTTITYGQVGTSGQLNSGDAFICDVNGDGKFNSENEMFYYVSDYYDTSSKTFNNKYAVLVYYNSVSSGVPDNSTGYGYDSSGENWHGPVTAINQLPTTSQWTNVSLYKTSRAILAENQSTHDATSTSGGTLPTAFNYSGRAARLLTAKELMNSCGLTEVGNYNMGELSSCNYLMENTNYSSSSTKYKYGFWLETPRSNVSNYIWYTNSQENKVAGFNAYSQEYVSLTYFGVRPVIEVLKTEIAY